MPTVTSLRTLEILRRVTTLLTASRRLRATLFFSPLIPMIADSMALLIAAALSAWFPMSV